MHCIPRHNINTVEHRRVLFGLHFWGWECFNKEVTGMEQCSKNVLTFMASQWIVDVGIPINPKALIKRVGFRIKTDIRAWLLHVCFASLYISYNL